MDVSASTEVKKKILRIVFVGSALGMVAAAVIAIALWPTKRAPQTNQVVMPPGEEKPTAIALTSNTNATPRDLAGEAWCWFGDPRAVYYNGYTYIGWISSSGDVVIGKHDNATKIMTTSVLHPNLEIDDHDNPSILIRPDGRLMVFYSAHAGQQMYYRISTNPGDISAWGSERTVPGDYRYTYPNPIQLPSEANKIYLFWRGNDWNPTFATSTDGLAWSTPKTLVDTGSTSYIKYASNGTDTIHFAFTDSHPELVAVNNLYYARYKNGSFYRADGSLIKNISALPLQTTEVDRVYNSQVTGQKAWVWDIAVDVNGNPVIVYATFPSPNEHVYHYARWNGSGWEDHVITAAGGSIDESGNDPYYSGGIILDHENRAVVYLSRQVGEAFEVEQWYTPDGGYTWRSNPLTTGSAEKNVRPFVPRNRPANGLAVLWLRGGYHSYTDYETQLASVSGNLTPPPCTRPAATLNIAPTVQRGYGGDARTYTITITNNDSLVCGQSAFALTNIDLPAGWTATPASLTFTLDPQEGANGTLVVTSPNTAHGGDYPFTLSFTHSRPGLPAEPLSGTATYTVGGPSRGNDQQISS